jgi:uncharacterized LabA/DUF88 family protein
MASVAIFIDGESFSIASRSLYGATPDYRALALLIARRWRHTLGPIYYYDSPSSNASTAPRQQRFWRVQEDRGITMKLGRLEHNGDGSYRQKEVDVMIACDMLSVAFTKSFERVALVSSDTDYAYAIECAMRLGLEVGWVYLRSQAHIDRLKLLIPTDCQLLIDDRTFRALRVHRPPQRAGRR